MVVTALATFLSPPTYEATASILVKKASAEVPLVPKESSQLIISQVTEEDLNSEMTILKSRQAIEDTLHGLGVDESWRHEGLLQRAWKARGRRCWGRPASPTSTRWCCSSRRRSRCSRSASPTCSRSATGTPTPSGPRGSCRA